MLELFFDFADQAVHGLKRNEGVQHDHLVSFCLFLIICAVEESCLWIFFFVDFGFYFCTRFSKLLFVILVNVSLET